MSKWCLEDDAIVSASEILKMGSIPSGLGENSYQFEEIQIAKPETSHWTIAFSVVDI